MVRNFGQLKWWFCLNFGSFGRAVLQPSSLSAASFLLHSRSIPPTLYPYLTWGGRFGSRRLILMKSRKSLATQYYQLSSVYANPHRNVPLSLWVVRWRLVPMVQEGGPDARGSIPLLQEMEEWAAGTGKQAGGKPAEERAVTVASAGELQSPLTGPSLRPGRP